MDPIAQERLETVVELRREESRRREHLAQLQAQIRKAQGRLAAVAAVNTQSRAVYVDVGFTDPPGTGRQRIQAILREIDEFQARRKTV